MYINSNLEIICRENGEMWTVKDGVKNLETDPARVEELSKVYNACRGQVKSVRPSIVKDLIDSGAIGDIFAEIAGGVKADAEESGIPMTEEEILTKALDEMMNFFSEFQFEPNFRFVNTFSKNLKKSKAKAKEYVQSYFELTDSPYTNDVREKMKSKEFSQILDEMSATAPTHSVNNRFKLYYGSQGTGKTTIAQKETDNRCVVCNSSMLPADLMEDFVFTDGKATFQKSMLWNCMENGEPLVMDEINLLPFDSLRFLQGILDGKTEFQYKGVTVHINDGFEIIGTMNLTVNGMTYGLPEPLVDRCAEMKKFKLSSKQLVSAIL